MKKKSAKAIKRDKRVKKHIAVKPKEMKLSRQTSEREVRKQLSSCEDLIRLVEDTLQKYGRHLDAGTTELSDSSRAELISILDTVHSDIESFAEELLPLQESYDTFRATEEMDAWDISATTISLCTSIDVLRSRHAHLLMVNQQSILDLFSEDNSQITINSGESK